MESLEEFDLIESDEDFIFVDSSVYELDLNAGDAAKAGENDGRWGAIEKACVRLLEKSKDIRVAIWYIRAGLERGEFRSLRRALEVLVGILEYPPDDIRPLSDSLEITAEVHAIHVTWLSSSQFFGRLGILRFPEVDLSVGEMCRGKAGLPLSGDLRKSLSADIDEVVNLLGRIKEWAEKSSISGVDIDGSISFLSESSRVLIGGIDQVVGDEFGRGVSSSNKLMGEGESAISDRSDVEAALDRVIKYFEIHEPSHPAPIFLMRVKKMIGADFSELMAELYSDGLELAAQLGRPGGVGK